jgi:Zn-finger nucleic acid-binding protein
VAPIEGRSRETFDERACSSKVFPFWRTNVLCPHCKIELKITERQGIEIDYCPTCRGVWLDRGELDKILERSAVTMPSAGAPGAYGSPAPGGYGAPPQRGWRDDDDDDDRRRYYGQPGYPQHGYRRRRESWLSDLFDFD